VGFLATVADQAFVGVLRLRPAPVPLSWVPIHSPNATYGHFGRTDIDLPWEHTDRVDALRSLTS
jgi:S-adenosylmethionine synthetase